MKKTYQMLSVALLGLCLFCFSCETPPPSEILPTATTPPTSTYASTANARVGGAGIGVSDVQRSVRFYTTVFGLDDVGPREGKLDRIIEEHILTDRDGQEIAIMDFGPNENYSRRPGKLVFAVGNTMQYYNKALSNGATGVSFPLLCRDPDGYIVEFFASSGVGRPLLAGVGVGSSNLRNSEAFYKKLDFTSTMTFPVPGLNNEIIMRSPGCSPSKTMGDFVPMKYTARMDYRDVPTKVTILTPNAVGFANAIRAIDPSYIILEPTATSTGYAKDLEGTLIEIVQD